MSKEEQDNRSKQKNPNNQAYYDSRGGKKWKGYDYRHKFIHFMLQSLSIPINSITKNCSISICQMEKFKCECFMRFLI